MGDTYSAIEIRSTIRTFQEYLRDLIECKFDQLQTKIPGDQRENILNIWL